MRGGGRNDFKAAALSQFAKAGKQIALVFIDKKAPAFAKHFEIKVRELAELRMFAVSLLFARGEIDQQIEVPHVTLTQEPILKHCAKRRRDRRGQLERHTLIDQAVHHAHQRDITLRYCLEEPVFFKKMLMFRMTNERQVRVKYERDRTGTHCGFRSAECGLIPLSARLELRNPQLPPRVARPRRFSVSPIRDCYSVRQKSWKRSKPFLMTSILVA